MRKSISKNCIAAGFVLALAFTFSCSGGDDDNGGGTSSPSGGGGDPSGGCDYAPPSVASPYCNDEESVAIGTQIWQKCNLKAVPSTGNHSCYCNKPENCDKYGRLYDWEAAMIVCPSGWHLPSKAEWAALATYIKSDEDKDNYYYDVGDHLMAAKGWFLTAGLDSYGFSALPGGYGNSGGSFDRVGYGGYWWNASEGSSSVAYRWDISYFGKSYWGSYDKSYLYSVRCLQD